jgi:hypothetical protein
MMHKILCSSLLPNLKSLFLKYVLLSIGAYASVDIYAFQQECLALIVEGIPFPSLWAIQTMNPILEIDAWLGEFGILLLSSINSLMELNPLRHRGNSLNSHPAKTQGNIFIKLCDQISRHMMS